MTDARACAAQVSIASRRVYPAGIYHGDKPRGSLQGINPHHSPEAWVVIELTQQGADVLVPVKVVPKASRDRIVGELGGALKIAVSAPPERGAANIAVCKLLAKALGLHTNQVSIDAGHGSPRKVVRIHCLSVDRVRTTLVALGGQ